MDNKPVVHDNIAGSNELRAVAGTSQVARRASKAWLFGAYTLLTLWGMAYLVLFFTDRLPF